MPDINLLDFIIQNIEWIFSGVGVFVLALFFKGKRSKNNSNKIEVSNSFINGDFTGRDRK